MRNPIEKFKFDKVVPFELQWGDLKGCEIEVSTMLTITMIAWPPGSMKGGVSV